MKETNKMTWYDIKLWQFNKLQELLNGTDDETEKLICMAEVIFGNDVTNLPLRDFNEKMKALDFLNQPVPESIPPKKVEINGRKYFIDCLLGNVSTAQYVDFTNHSKEEKPDLTKMLSVFVIPEGHKYNDGYDMLQVINDINDLPIPIVNNIAFFFGRQYSKFMKIFQSYSIKQIRKTKLPKEVKKQLIEVVQKSTDLVLSPLFLNSVK